MIPMRVPRLRMSEEVVEALIEGVAVLIVIGIVGLMIAVIYVTGAP